MYGLVNRGCEDMIVRAHGPARWAEIKAKAAVETSYFHAHESYPDRLTYDLVGAAAEVLGESPAALLESFGIHWVLHTATDGYGFLLDMAGGSLPEFLVNLPDLHTRVRVAFPHLNPPTFACADVREGSLLLRYASERQGLVPFVIGLLKGLGRRFGTPVRVTSRGAVGPTTHELFVEWGAAAA